MANFDLPTAAITRVLFEDADNDGEKELLLCSEYDAFVVNATTFQIEFQFNAKQGMW
ncbi:MAG: hypothetical protein IPM82_19625 [Saprospiraceae bacterium]|nr:hypothetical protein [Saprospiraceae bacterium]